jgi:acyl-coenzyme A synthetase/AMP-(fatty) acid ligase
MQGNGPEFLELYLACSRLGAVFVPLNFRLTAPELHYVLRNSRPRVFVFGSAGAETVATLRLNHRRPLMELSCVGKGPSVPDVFDYHSGVKAFVGQKPFLTKFLGVPTVYRALLRVEHGERADLSSLQVCAIGGEKTTHELLFRCMEAGFSLRRIMGQTETSILLWASEEASLQKPGTVGRPVFHAEVNLFGRDGRPVRPGEIGPITNKISWLSAPFPVAPKPLRPGALSPPAFPHCGSQSRRIPPSRQWAPGL